MDREFQKIIKKKFPVEYEAHLQELMRARLAQDNRFRFEIEIGHYYNGYENLKSNSNFIDTMDYTFDNFSGFVLKLYVWVFLCKLFV